MRSNQWYVLGLAFFILMIWFIYQDLLYNCLTFAEQMVEPLNRGDIYECVNSEIFDPFIYFFGVMWFVCWINGWLEKRAKH